MVGDAHGCVDTVTTLLQQRELLDDSYRWAGDTSRLWFIGDLTDRGPDGIGMIELVMRLQREARETGGMVGCLLGNHEVFLLGARRFLETPLGLGDMSFLELWAMNGGKRRDLDALTADHLAWLTGLPSVVTVGNHGLVHCDSDFYVDLGDTADEINASIQNVLQGDDIENWSILISAFVRRNELWDSAVEGERSLQRLSNVLRAGVIVHGHTPIPMVTNIQAEDAVEPFIYSKGRCINVDGGMFLGSPGIAVRLRQ